MRTYKLLIWTLFLALILQSCKKQSNYNFLVKGTITSAPQNTKAYLYRALPTGNKLLDSATVDGNGQFELKGTTHEKDFFIVNFSGNNYNIYLIIDSADVIELSGNYKDLLNTYDVQGSADSRLIRQLERHLAQTKKKLDSLAGIYTRLTDEGKTDSAQIIDSLIQTVLKEQKRFSSGFVFNHYNNLAALPALSQVYVPGKGIFDPNEDSQLYFMVDSALGRLYPRNMHVLKLHSFVSNIRINKRRQMFNVYKIREGSEAPEFTVKDIQGNTVSLNGLLDKDLYLVFCSVWCDNCGGILETAVRLQNSGKYNVLLFCLATDKQEIKEYMAKHPGMANLKIVSDYKLWNSPIVKKYEVVKIPTVFLISQQGKIISINPGEQELQNKR